MDVSPKQIHEWKGDLIAFRNMYVEYLNKTRAPGGSPQSDVELRSKVIRFATPAQTTMNAIGADVSWFPPPATGGPVLSGLLNMVFLHEGPHGWSGSGMFGDGTPPYQAVIDGVDTSLAWLDRLEAEIHRKRRNPLYWVDRLLRALLGLPAYLVSLVFQVPLSRIEGSPWGTALRLLTLLVDIGLLVFGAHEWFGWF